MNNADCKQMDRYLSKLKSSIRYRLDEDNNEDAVAIRDKIQEFEILIANIQEKNGHIGIIVKKWFEQNSANFTEENTEVKVSGITANSIGLFLKNTNLNSPIDLNKARQQHIKDLKYLFNEVEEYFKIENAYPTGQNAVFFQFKLSKKLLRDDLLNDLAPVIIEKMKEQYNLVKVAV
jgi:hypothetical protein